VERVKYNAQALNVPYENELYRVMIHGILHLCGYQDHNQKEKSLMRSKEDFYLNRL
jgi:rRNA maturation RNase YbeY